MRSRTTSNIPLAHAPRARGERAFSIIEVIIAMLVLTVVLAAGVFAIAGSERVSRGASIMQQKTAVAQRALERAEGDLAQQATCNSTLWLNDTPPGFRTCRFTYADMRDSQGRQYRADVRVTPVDDASDGQGRADTTRAGAGDSDFQSRDYYRAEVTITIPDPVAQAALAPAHRGPYSMANRLDWALNEHASLEVNVCSHYRMDRSVEVGGCGAGTHTPVGGVTVRLTPVGTSANKAVARSLPVGASGKASVTNVLPAGDYRVTATDVTGFNFYRASPEYLKVEAGARHEVSILMTSDPGTTHVCYQVINPDDGWGYWVDETNFSWQEDKSLVYRNGRMRQIGQSMRCQNRPLPDPLGYDPLLFVNGYAISLQEVRAGSIPSHPDKKGLVVDRVERDCLKAVSPAVPAGGAGNPARLPTPWLGMYPQLPGTHQLCFYFRAFPIQSVDCGGPAPGCVNRPVCVPTWTGPVVPALAADPCIPPVGPPPVSGPFDPCPGGTTGPLQKSGPDPTGTYKGPILAHFGGPKMSTYYGPGYECNPTASGERFDINKLTASTLTTRGWVGYGWGSCARVTGARGEAIIKLNDTGSNAHALLDLSPGATIGLGFRPGDNPVTNVHIIEKNVKNGQGCSAWEQPPADGGKCPVAQVEKTGACTHVYPPTIENHWVKPEAEPGAANPGGVDPMGNSGSSRRSL